MEAKSKGNGGKEYLKEKVSNIVDGKLSPGELDELIGFFRQALGNDLGQEDERFFRSLAYEMTGDVKDLALLICDFRKDLKTKIHPQLTDLATKYIPMASDQLEGIIETTEMAANKIMDNLENMQTVIGNMKKVCISLNEGKVVVPGEEPDGDNIEMEQSAIMALSPATDYMRASVHGLMSLVSDTFVQMSFQDLTGQRIKRIMHLVSEMEDRIKNMVISFGIRLNEREKNPSISDEELKKAVEEKVTDLLGPQKKGQGLGQSDIDSLLAGL